MTKVILYSMAGGLATLLALSLIKRKPTMKRIPVNRPVAQSTVVSPTQQLNITSEQMPMVKNLSNLVQRAAPIQSTSPPKPPTLNAELIRKINLAIKK